MVKDVVGENPCQRLTSGPESSDISHQGTARGYSSCCFQPHQTRMCFRTSQEPLRKSRLENEVEWMDHSKHPRGSFISL